MITDNFILIVIFIIDFFITYLLLNKFRYLINDKYHYSIKWLKVVYFFSRILVIGIWLLCSSDVMGGDIGGTSYQNNMTALFYLFMLIECGTFHVMLLIKAIIGFKLLKQIKNISILVRGLLLMVLLLVVVIPLSLSLSLFFIAYMFYKK